MVDTGIICVIRAKQSDEAIKIANAVVAGGVTGVEITYSVPRADSVIERLVDQYDSSDVVVGAGTVLDATSARLAIIAGANFIVSPTFDREVALMCNLYQIPYIPGAYTITEAQEALKYGAEMIKLFPGELAGTATIKAYHGPFPYLNVMPTGGVTLANMVTWFEAGASVVGIGTGITGPASQGDLKAVMHNAQQFIEQYREIRRTH